MIKDDRVTGTIGIGWVLALIGMLLAIVLLAGCCSMCPVRPCEPQIKIVEKIVTVYIPAPCLKEELPMPDLWILKLNYDTASLDEIVNAAVHDNGVLVNYIKVMREATKCSTP